MTEEEHHTLASEIVGKLWRHHGLPTNCPVDTPVTMSAVALTELLGQAARSGSKSVAQDAREVTVTLRFPPGSGAEKSLSRAKQLAECGAAEVVRRALETYLHLLDEVADGNRVYLGPSMSGPLRKLNIMDFPADDEQAKRLLARDVPIDEPDPPDPADYWKES